mmetsp:Transcript_34887/g.68680  ORF Transcript_34887/g.68680 Transcript_34887/m.68680 type:complete len:323 (-) Transcript_34887:116-1084(-)
MRICHHFPLLLLLSLVSPLVSDVAVEAAVDAAGDSDSGAASVEHARSLEEARMAVTTAEGVLEEAYRAVAAAEVVLKVAHVARAAAEGSDLPTPSPPPLSADTGAATPLSVLLGPSLYRQETVSPGGMVRIVTLDTDAALRGKKVIGLYFSADCEPSVKFTAELVAFYHRINARRSREHPFGNQFEIIWVSRCRDDSAFAATFSTMGWLALPPAAAHDQTGQALVEKFDAEKMPYLLLLDEEGGVLTTDARKRVKGDRAGVGFPWKSPWHVLYHALVPRSARRALREKVMGVPWLPPLYRRGRKNLKGFVKFFFKVLLQFGS